jgi:transcriptional regulator with XRE-family HTH domain
MSQEALADSSGLDRSHLGRIERGERNLTLMNLMRVAEALDVRASQILIDACL